MGHNIGECKCMFLHHIFVEFKLQSSFMGGGGGWELWRTMKKLVNYGHYLSFQGLKRTSYRYDYMNNLNIEESGF